LEKLKPYGLGTHMNWNEKRFTMVYKLEVDSITHKRARGQKLCEKWESGEAFDNTT